MSVGFKLLWFERERERERERGWVLGRWPRSDRSVYEIYIYIYQCGSFLI